MTKTRILAGVALAALFSGCGGGGSPSGSTPAPAPTPTPTGSFRTVLEQRAFALNAGAASFFPLDNLVPGTVEANVNWSNAANNVKVYITDNNCSGVLDLRGGRCNVMARSEAAGTKPRQVSAPTGTNSKLFVWIDNDGGTAESGSLEAAILTTTPYAAPTPPPVTGDPRDSLPAGPVYTARIKMRSVDTGNFVYRDFFENGDGTWSVYVGEFVVFDFTQKNAAGQECKWVNEPKWTIDDVEVQEGGTDPRGVFRRRGSSQPFLLRVDVEREGSVRIQGTIDGVFSNFIEIRAARR